MSSFRCAYSRRSQVLEKLGRRREALELYEKACLLAPESPAVRFKRVRILISLRQYQVRSPSSLFSFSLTLSAGRRIRPPQPQRPRAERVQRPLPPRQAVQGFGARTRDGQGVCARPRSGPEGGGADQGAYERGDDGGGSVHVVRSCAPFLFPRIPSSAASLSRQSAFPHSYFGFHHRLRRLLRRRDLRGLPSP